ncbi:putative protein YneK, partial [Escherichia coli]|uniref:putative protein YneK n=2 Tax=Escherichia coli TaxID=562 RepID=UPI0028E064F3
ADRNRSHWSTSKTPSYTKSVSWQHHLNDVLMPASLSDDKIIKHMARRTLKLFVKNETPPKVTHEDLVKNRPRSPVRPPIPATAKTPDLPERH